MNSVKLDVLWLSKQAGQPIAFIDRFQRITVDKGAGYL